MFQTVVTVKLYFLHFPHKEWLQQQVKQLHSGKRLSWAVMHSVSYRVLNKSNVLSTRTLISLTPPSEGAEVITLYLPVTLRQVYLFKENVKKDLSGNFTVTQEDTHSQKTSATRLQSQRICSITVAWKKHWLHTCCWTEWLSKFERDWSAWFYFFGFK